MQEKKVYWETTYGTIEIISQILKEKQTQKRVRPFEEAADVACRSYSLPLQRAMTDFGADESFAKAAKKLKEHYGIDVSAHATQRITEAHAQVIHLDEDSMHQRSMERKDVNTVGRVADVIISELDGSMVPIVEFIIPSDVSEDEVDLRKYRELGYKEARLTLAHEKNSVTPVYGATMGSVHEAGKQLRVCAEAVGFHDKTKIHGVGDGAPWIANQFEEQFGSQSSYLIDFYHLCEYLAGAASKIPNSQIWIERQKILLKNSQANQVLMELRPYLEAENIPDENAPVRACYRYIDNRNGQFLYKESIENDLPIGSGEVESEHRYISQKRLKIPGAWWKIEHAENMLSLRVLRANEKWADYWEIARLKNAA